MEEESNHVLEKRLMEIRNRRLQRTAFEEVMTELLLEVDQHFKSVQQKIQQINTNVGSVF